MSLTVAQHILDQKRKNPNTHKHWGKVCNERFFSWVWWGIGKCCCCCWYRQQWSTIVKGLHWAFDISILRFLADNKKRSEIDLSNADDEEERNAKTFPIIPKLSAYSQWRHERHWSISHSTQLVINDKVVKSQLRLWIEVKGECGVKEKFINESLRLAGDAFLQPSWVFYESLKRIKNVENNFIH